MSHHICRPLFNTVHYYLHRAPWFATNQQAPLLMRFFSMWHVSSSEPVLCASTDICSHWEPVLHSKGRCIHNSNHKKWYELRQLAFEKNCVSHLAIEWMSSSVIINIYCCKFCCIDDLRIAVYQKNENSFYPHLWKGWYLVIPQQKSFGSFSSHPKLGIFGAILKNKI